MKITKKFLREIYGIKHIPDGRYADGFYEALKYYGFKREEIEKIKHDANLVEDDHE